MAECFCIKIAEREAVNRPRGRKGASCSGRWALATSRSRTWLGISTETYSQVAASIKLTWAIRDVSASIQAVAELAPSCELAGGLARGTLPAAVKGALATAYCEMKRFALMHYNAEPATANGRILDVFGMEHL
jgi:hypothetical protein